MFLFSFSFYHFAKQLSNTKSALDSPPFSLNLILSLIIKYSDLSNRPLSVCLLFIVLGFSFTKFSILWWKFGQYITNTLLNQIMCTEKKKITIKTEPGQKKRLLYNQQNTIY